jgi:hypothetical protein
MSLLYIGSNPTPFSRNGRKQNSTDTDDHSIVLTFVLTSKLQYQKTCHTHRIRIEPAASSDERNFCRTALMLGLLLASSSTQVTASSRIAVAENTAQPRIKELLQPGRFTLDEELLEPREQALEIHAHLLLPAVHRPVADPLPPDQLEEHDPEAVHVGLPADGQAQRPLRRDVPPGAPRPGLHRPAHRERVPAEQLHQPEVGDLGLQVRVQQDVLRLHVAVQDSLQALVVEVGQALGHADGALVPRAPPQHSFIGTVEEGLGQRAVLDVLGDEQAVRVLGAEAPHPDQVHVVDPPDDAQLRPEHLLGLLRHLFQ